MLQTQPKTRRTLQQSTTAPTNNASNNILAALPQNSGSYQITSNLLK